MENKNAINFLLYSYFGITLDSSADEVLCAAIDRAYRDASSHVLSIKDEDTKLKKKDDAAIEIRGQLQELEKAPSCMIHGMVHSVRVYVKNMRVSSTEKTGSLHTALPRNGSI